MSPWVLLDMATRNMLSLSMKRVLFSNMATAKPSVAPSAPTMVLTSTHGARHCSVCSLGGASWSTPAPSVVAGPFPPASSICLTVVGHGASRWVAVPE